MTDNKQKLAALSQCMGTEEGNNYDNHLTSGLVETFDSSLILLIDDFNPYKNLQHEMFQYCQIKQNLEKTINRYYSSV